MKMGVLFVASLLVISAGLVATVPVKATDEALACPSYVCNINNGNPPENNHGPPGYLHWTCNLSPTKNCDECCNECNSVLESMEDPKIVGVCDCVVDEDFTLCTRK